MFSLVDGFVRTDVVVPNDPFGINLGLLLESPDGSRLSWALVNGGLSVDLSENGQLETLFVESVEDPAPGSVLQIREVDGVFFFEASADGVDFQPMFSAVAPLDSSQLEVGIIAGNFIAFEEPQLVFVESFEMCTSEG